jgi:hypothetical protein
MHVSLLGIVLAGGVSNLGGFGSVKNSSDLGPVVKSSSVTNGNRRSQDFIDKVKKNIIASSCTAQDGSTVSKSRIYMGLVDINVIT